MPFVTGGYGLFGMLNALNVVVFNEEKRKTHLPLSAADRCAPVKIIPKWNHLWIPFLIIDLTPISELYEFGTSCECFHFGFDCVYPFREFHLKPEIEEEEADKLKMKNGDASQAITYAHAGRAADFHQITLNHIWGLNEKNVSSHQIHHNHASIVFGLVERWRTYTVADAAHRTVARQWNWMFPLEARNILSVFVEFLRDRI